jgi:hypothetical protein
MKKLEYTATGGETGFTSDLLIGKTILSVLKDGVGYTKIVSAIPTDKEVQYLTTGMIGFSQPLTPGEPVLVLYQDNGNVCFPVSVSGTLPDAVAGVPYSASLFINGTAPYSIVPTPSWITITLTSNQVVFSGTPSISDAGSNTVAFTLSNPCGSLPFSQLINVSVPEAQFEATTFVSGDRLTDVEIANISGVSGIVVTVTLDNYINSNGGNLKVNGTVASLDDTWNITLGALGGTLNVEIDGIVNPGTAILGHFTITGVSAGEIGLSKTYQISKAFS